jgi:hypothetical protein
MIGASPYDVERSWPLIPWSAVNAMSYAFTDLGCEGVSIERSTGCPADGSPAVQQRTLVRAGFELTKEEVEVADEVDRGGLLGDVRREVGSRYRLWCGLA